VSPLSFGLKGNYRDEYLVEIHILKA